MIKYTIGLDVSSKDMKACFGSFNIQQKFKVHSTRTFTNNNSGLKEFLKWVNKYQKIKEIPLRICMEATGVYHELYAFGLQQKSYSVSVVLANKAKKYFQYLGIKSKNDKIDAKGLAQMAAEQDLKLWTPGASYYYHLRKLTRQHQSLQESKTVIKGKIHAEKASVHQQRLILKQYKQQEKLLNKQLEIIELRIQDHIESNPEVSEKINKITKIKGLGILSVSVIVAETFGFELFENVKQLLSYSGYDVVENQSGKRAGRTKISKKGNSRIRRILHLPAFSIVRYQEAHFKLFFNRVLSKHNIKMKAYTAVQKKILVTIFALWKKNEEYNNNYQQSKTNEMKRIKQSPDIIIETSPGKHIETNSEVTSY